MRGRLLALWEQLRTSFWFVPTLMVLGASGLALTTVAIDESERFAFVSEVGWVYTGGPEGARALLSTVAGSVITVAGVTFSITIAALTLASSQFGPRLLRSFVRDTGNQVVLGTFIATFTYCLLVLRTVRGVEDIRFVPHISVSVGVALAMASLGVLIYFIHHVAISIQVEQVIAAVSEELDEAIDRLFPERLGHGPPPETAPHQPDSTPALVVAHHGGYVQVIDTDALMHLACEHDLVLRLVKQPGDFVVVDDALACIWPEARADEEVAGRLNQAFVLGTQRTHIQDVLFAVNQLVEVAVRALSPGINDPFTAMVCIDRLGAALCRVAGRRLPALHRYDDGGRLRVIVEPVTFAAIVNAAVDQIRQYGRTSAAVTMRLLEMLTVVATHSDNPAHHEALLRQGAIIERGSRSGLPYPSDQQEVAERYQALVQAVERLR